MADLRQLLPDIIDLFKEHTPSYDLEFSVHAPFNDLNLASLNPKLRELAVRYIKTTIELAAELAGERDPVADLHLVEHDER